MTWLANERQKLAELIDKNHCLPFYTVIILTDMPYSWNKFRIYFQIKIKSLSSD